MGSLDELTICGRDLGVFFAVPPGPLEPTTFPHTKRLSISEQNLMTVSELAILELAKSQHMLGTPSEHVEIRARGIPEAMGGG